MVSKGTMKSDQRPECFGNMSKVFPRGEDGLRHSPEECFACPENTQCLRSALQGAEGIDVEEEHLDRAYHSGMIGFFERWSRRKILDSRKKNRGRKGNAEFGLRRAQPSRMWKGEEEIED